MPTKAIVNLKKSLLALLEEHKAENSILLDISKLTDIADFMILVSGTSTPHLKALSDKVKQRAKRAGFRPIGVSGTAESGWILIDLGDIIVHVMMPEIREFYALEELWDSGFAKEYKQKPKILKAKRQLLKKTSGKVEKSR